MDAACWIGRHAVRPANGCIAGIRVRGNCLDVCRGRPVNYKIAFVATLFVLVALVTAAAVVFDRTIEGYFVPLVVNGTANTYEFLDPVWYEGIDILPMSYERIVQTAGDFEGWKKGYANSDLSAGLHHPASVVVTSSVERDGHTLNRLLIDGSLVVYEALPDRPNGKAVVVVPGTGHQGARDIMGVPSEYSVGYYHGDMGMRLAQAGYAAYAPELLGWGERQVDVGSTCAGPGQDAYTCSFHVFSNSLSLYGISTGAIHANESAKAFAYALSRHDRVALAGLSNGCSNANILAHANPGETGAVVLASCVGRTHEWPMGASLSGSGQNLHAEPVDAVRALAPLPLYVSYGQLELGLYAYAVESGDIERMVAEAYGLVGAPGKFTYVVHDGGHTYDVDSVIKFLDASY